MMLELCIYVRLLLVYVQNERIEADRLTLANLDIGHLLWIRSNFSSPSFLLIQRWLAFTNYSSSSYCATIGNRASKKKFFLLVFVCCSLNGAEQAASTRQHGIVVIIKINKQKTKVQHDDGDEDGGSGGANERAKWNMTLAYYFVFVLRSWILIEIVYRQFWCDYRVHRSMIYGWKRIENRIEIG